MRTSFRASFVRDLKKVRDERVLAAVEAAVREVEAASAPGELAGVKKMSGGGSYYRIRIGEYRMA